MTRLAVLHEVLWWMTYGAKPEDLSAAALHNSVSHCCLQGAAWKSGTYTFCFKHLLNHAFIRLDPYVLFHFTQRTLCLQCFDTVGWAAGRASGL